MTRVEQVLGVVARLYPRTVGANDGLDRALAFLGTELASETVVRAGYGGAIVVLSLLVPVVVLVPNWAVTPVALAGLLAAGGAAIAGHLGPTVLATAKRTRALGRAPALVTRAVLRMRVTPATEPAAAFAAQTAAGPLAASLEEHVHRARGQPASGFETFAEEWADLFPALRRSLLLVESAGAAPVGERERVLDRSVTAILDGTREEMTAFAASVKGPTTALFAFGVLVPLALVAMLPAARVTGVPVPFSWFVAVFDVLLPAALLGTSAWLLARRPVAFPPPTVDRSHPDVPDRWWPTIGVSLVAAVVGALGGALVVAPWAGLVGAVGGGCGTGLVWRFRPAKRVRDRTRAVEAGLPDALYHVGRQVEDGRSVEAAMADVAGAVADPTGAVFADAARRQRQLSVGVPEAFLGPHGALASVPSPRASASASLLGLAASEGPPAGGAIVAIADHLDELATVEAEAEQAIASVTGTLANTGALFGPLVAGTTVALADGLTVQGVVVSTTGPGTGAVGLAVGWYVLLLAAILTTLSTGLSKGLDRSLVGYRVGWAVLASTASFLAAIHVTSLFV
jgi:hypothetical protein